MPDSEYLRLKDQREAQEKVRLAALLDLILDGSDTGASYTGLRAKLDRIKDQAREMVGERGRS